MEPPGFLGHPLHCELPNQPAMLQGPRQAAHWYLEHHPTSNQSNLIYPLMRPALLPYCHMMQDQGEGLQPLAFMSKALKPSERRYSAYERELAAIAYCFLQWRHYLEGCPGGVNVVTDHQLLTLLMQ